MLQTPAKMLSKSRNNVRWAIVALCLSYLIFQLIYIPYAALSVDEFWFAHHIYEYTHKLPYRDFLPYKTVLGYYLFSIPFFFSHSILQPLYYIKTEIALINTLFLLGVSFWLLRFYHPKALLYTFLLILANHLFLIYSVDLRVDMLTSWLALISILLILSNRFALAGMLLALSFMISQKALWFFVATNLSLGCYWLLITRNRQLFRDSIIFNLSFLLPIMVYIAFWAHQSNLRLVLNSVFYEGYTQAKITYYSTIYYQCWNVILSNGPLLILLWPLTWLPLFVRMNKDKTDHLRRIFIAIYSSSIMFFILSYQQAFPYGMVYAVPVYFLIYPDFFSWLAHLFRQKTDLIYFNSRRLFWFLSLYTIGIISIVIVMQLPFAYFLVALIPVCLGILIMAPHLTHAGLDSIKISLIILFVCTGLLYPLFRFVLIAYMINGDYQKSMVTISNELLKEGSGGYFAGIPLIYNQDQAIRGLKNLISPASAYINKPSKELLPILIASLYLEPRNAEEILHDLTITPIKFYVNNYRIGLLPDSIHHYLQSEFTHYWGSIYIYAPSIAAKKQQFSLKFSGNYQVLAKPNTKIYLDNKKIIPNAVITLKEGMHQSNAAVVYRLKYVPQHMIDLDWHYANDRFYNLIKAIVT
jgi:hypothetical protein